jgi:preprotein translocase subunit SecA
MGYFEPVTAPKPYHFLWSRCALAYAKFTAPKRLQRVMAQATEVAQLAEEFSTYSEVQLRQKMVELKPQLAKKNNADQTGLMTCALAILMEVATRTLQQRPYHVQVAAALAMLEEEIVQLAPGEGKTLTIALVSVVFAWAGKPCYVVTSNDYLAARDAAELEPFYTWCGVSVSSIDGEIEPDEKALRYGANVVYSTSKQLLADYLLDTLRAGGKLDRLTLTLSHVRGKHYQPLMRGLHTVIIDEVDSILIDEATVPLIISEPRPEPMLMAGVHASAQLIEQLLPEVHYRLDRVHREIDFTAKGMAMIDRNTPSLPPLWQHPERRKDILKQAIMARDYYQRDVHYVIDEDEIVIVDESTGRMMSGRTWSGGLHQAIELKEGVTLTDPNVTRAKMSFQNFFKLFHRLCGASGTLQTIEAELFLNYGRTTLNIPSRKASQIEVKPWQSFPTALAKWQHLIALIESFYQQGRPLLIGTRNVDDSERLATLLTEKNLPFSLLNAKQHAQEADIVARAGQAFSITVATNMAGRGTDIKVSPEALQQGGLVVCMLEPHESARVDWQLFGRTGRQGHPGLVIPLVAWDDHLLRMHTPIWLRPLLWRLRALPQWLVRLLINQAQKAAQLKAFRQRQRLNKSDQKSREALSFAQ